MRSPILPSCIQGKISMRYFGAALFFLLLVTSALFAQSSSSAKQVSVEAILSADKIQSGQTAQIAIMLKINEGWHVNSHKPTFDYLIGTRFELQQVEGIIVTDVQYPDGKLVPLSFADQPIDVYEGTTILFASIKLSDKMAPGSDTLKGSVTVQACNNQLCLAPSTMELSIPVEIVAAGAPVTPQNQEIFAQYKISASAGVTNNDLAAMLEEKGSFLTFLAIFLIGLALNLTPCVYPMLSVTVSLFGSQTETNVVRVFLKAVLYVLGIATMYSILGVSAALGGGLFGSWLQSPWASAASRHCCSDSH